MILWLVFFLLIIAISFILAFQSMKDFHEVSPETPPDYGLFLVRQIKNLDTKLLDSIRQLMLAEKEILSLERLFKGRQTAVTIFGPKNILARFQSELDILELEDYTLKFKDGSVSVWEMGARDSKLNSVPADQIFSNLPQLREEEQFFWQVILNKSQVQIRAAVSSNDPMRKKMFTSAQNLNTGGLYKIPKPLSNEQMIELYKARSMGKANEGLNLDSEGIISLMKV